tara:strand:+ start:136 stop:1143 length:1008 start_codon:yes stop_codon:yes gene_type:complete
MYDNLNLIIIFATLILSLIFFLNLKFISQKLKVFDTPDKKLKLHKNKVFLGGGVIFFIITTFIFFSEIFFFETEFFFLEGLKRKFVFFFGLCCVFILGISDDKYNLSYKIKFIYLILIIYICISLDNNLIVNNLSFETFDYIIKLENFNLFFTCICFLIFINALNLFDGLNLQSGTYIFTIFFCFIFVLKQNFFIYYIPSFFLFLFFNYKSKIFLGNSGSLFFGFLISYFAIKFYNFNYISIEEIFLIMFIPVIDMLRLFLTRISKNKNPFTGDRNHIHHILSSNFNETISFIIIQINIIGPLISHFYFKLSINLSILFGILFYFLLILKFKKNS